MAAMRLVRTLDQRSLLREGNGAIKYRRRRPGAGQLRGSHAESGTKLRTLTRASSFFFERPRNAAATTIADSGRQIRVTLDERRNERAKVWAAVERFARNVVAILRRTIQARLRSENLTRFRTVEGVGFLIANEFVPQNAAVRLLRCICVFVSVPAGLIERSDRIGLNE